jgi:hypothetical protein
LIYIYDNSKNLPVSFSSFFIGPETEYKFGFPGENGIGFIFTGRKKQQWTQ